MEDKAARLPAVREPKRGQTGTEREAELCQSCFAGVPAAVSRSRPPTGKPLDFSCFLAENSGFVVLTGR